MRAFVLGLLPLAMATGADGAPRRAVTSKPAAAATPAPVPQRVETSGRFDAAPWWMDRAVLPQTGFSETEVEANLAKFAARFRGTGKTASEAQRQAVAQTESLMAVLRKRSSEEVRVTTDYRVTAFYEQYRDSDGRMVANARGDKIKVYDAILTLRIEVRRMAALESVYALVLAAAPTEVDSVRFDLQTDNGLRERLRSEAVKDAGVRAQGAAAATGSQLGAIRLIDPSGRACNADILGRSPDTSEGIAVTGARVEYKGAPQMISGPPPPPPAPGQLEAKALENAFIQTPPLYRVRVQTCVVYDLK